jgi:CRISPR system Cascade subunit CasE
MSRIKLGTSLSRRALVSNPNKIHGIIESAFADKRREGKATTLWRIDRLAGEDYLLILSEHSPNLSDAVRQLSDYSTAETIDYDRYLVKIEAGRRYRFRLLANPVFRDSKTGKLKSIAGIAERDEQDIAVAGLSCKSQTEWLLSRAGRLGFETSGGEFNVIKSGWLDFYKGGGDSKRNRVQIKTALYEGVLLVTDAERFRDTLKCGVGREKAYGCGLMTVIEV